jgi:selenocysteine lyase/cysteine desulfurase
MLLENQKHLFSLPDDVHYLNCATMSPLLKSVETVGIEGLLRKSQPYNITQDHYFDTIEVVKTEFAQLINCDDPQRIALMGSVSYGLATVAKNLMKRGLAQAGKKIVMVGEEFPSIVYAWDELKENGVQIELVTAPDSLLNRGEHWNKKLIESIDNQVVAVCISPSHWSDGTLFELQAIGARCREVGALFCIDGTQHIGAYPFDIQEVKADFVVCATYKWLLGPYGHAMAYLSEWFDDGTPLEQNWAMRKNSNDFKNLIHFQSEYRPKAYRYNIGEMSNFTNLPMIAEALRQLNAWGVSNIQAYAKDLTNPYLDALHAKGFWIEKSDYRASHLFGIRLPEGVDLSDIQQALVAQKVFVSYRGTAIRVAVHLWNDHSDMEIFTETLMHSV